MPHYMHVAPEEETAMRLGQLPHNPRWALNLFACVAILGAANAAGVHYLQLDKSTTARYVSTRRRAFRAAAAFWIFFVALSKLFVKGFWPLTKYTDQTYLLLGSYFALGASNGGGGRVGPRAMHLLYECSVCASIAVCAVTWGILYPEELRRPHGLSDRYFNWWSFNQHGLNALLVLADAAFSGLPVLPAHFVVSVSWPTFYTVQAWMLHAATGEWHYSFMDPYSQHSPRTYAIFVAFYLGNFAAISILDAALRRLGWRSAVSKNHGSDDMLGLSPRSGKESPAMSRRDEEGQEEEEEGGFEFAGESTQHI